MRCGPIQDACGRQFIAWAPVTRTVRVDSQDPTKLKERMRTFAVRQVHVVRIVQARRKDLGRELPAMLEVRTTESFKAQRLYVTERQLYLQEPVWRITDPAITGLAQQLVIPPLDRDEWFLDAVAQNGGSWWQSERGALERVATIYEELHPEPPASGWHLITGDDAAKLVGEYRQGRAPKIMSELEEQPIRAQIAKLEKRAERLRTSAASYDRKAKAATRTAAQKRADLGRVERQIAKITGRLA